MLVHETRAQKARPQLAPTSVAAMAMVRVVLVGEMCKERDRMDAARIGCNTRCRAKRLDRDGEGVEEQRTT